MGGRRLQPRINRTRCKIRTERQVPRDHRLPRLRCQGLCHIEKDRPDIPPGFLGIWMSRHSRDSASVQRPATRKPSIEAYFQAACRPIYDCFTPVSSLQALLIALPPVTRPNDSRNAFASYLTPLRYTHHGFHPQARHLQMDRILATIRLDRSSVARASHRRS